MEANKPLLVDQGSLVMTGASQLLVPGNMRRARLIISAPPVNRITISFNRAAVLGQGITLYPTSAPFYLDVEQHGNAISGDIFVIASAAGDTVGWAQWLR